jgi:hypothetical protein
LLLQRTTIVEESSTSRPSKLAFAPIANSVESNVIEVARRRRASTRLLLDRRRLVGAVAAL